MKSSQAISYVRKESVHNALETVPASIIRDGYDE